SVVSPILLLLPLSLLIPVVLLSLSLSPLSTLFPYTTLFRSDFDFLTSNKVWIATDRSRARRCVEACVYGTLDFVGYPRFPNFVTDRKSGSAGMPRPISYAVFCLKKKTAQVDFTRCTHTRGMS